MTSGGSVGQLSEATLLGRQSFLTDSHIVEMYSRWIHRCCLHWVLLKLVIALRSQYTAMELVNQVPGSWIIGGKWGRL
jgi:hypothetical protein